LALTPSQSPLSQETTAPVTYQHISRHHGSTGQPSPAQCSASRQRKPPRNNASHDNPRRHVATSHRTTPLRTAEQYSASCQYSPRL